MGRKRNSSGPRDIEDLRMNEYQAYYLNRKYRTETKREKRNLMDTDEELLKICQKKGWTVKTNKRARRSSVLCHSNSDSEDSIEINNNLSRRCSDIGRTLRKHKGKSKLYGELPRRNLISEYSDDNNSFDDGHETLKRTKGKSFDSSDHVNTDTDISASDGGRLIPKFQGNSRQGNVELKRCDWYYRSNLQTVIREIRKLNFSALDIQYLKKTPFWFLVDAISKEDNDLLVDFTKKFDDDIRALVSRFDNESGMFVFGEGVLDIKKIDVVLVFGVRDGRIKIKVTKDFKRTEWMSRCFGDLLAGDYTRCTKQLTKGHIYKVLRSQCGDIDDEVSKDVARLLHCYLLAAFFLPNGNTSIAWCLCKYVEDIESIDLYDWSTLIVDHIKDQLHTISTMKLTGCALLLPYLICEHMDIIPSCQAQKFPRFMKWDLALLHRKLRRINLDRLSKQDIVRDLKPSRYEVQVFKEHSAENHVIFPLEYQSSDDCTDTLNSDELVDVDLMINLSDHSPFKKRIGEDKNSFEVNGEEENFVVQDTFEKLAGKRETTNNSSTMKGSSVDLDLCLGGRELVLKNKMPNNVNLNDPLFEVPSFSLGMGLSAQIKDDYGSKKALDAGDLVVSEGFCTRQQHNEDTENEQIQTLKDENERLIKENAELLECNKSYEHKIAGFSSKVEQCELLHMEIEKLKGEIVQHTSSDTKIESILDETKKELMKKTVELEVFQRQSEEMITFLDHELEALRNQTTTNCSVLTGEIVQQSDEYMVKYLSLNAAHESLMSVYESEHETWKCEIEQQKQVLEELEKKLEASEATADTLGKKIDELLNPTATQVFSHPDTIRLVDMMESIRGHENDKIEMKKYIENLIQYCKQLEYEVGVYKNAGSTSASRSLVKCEPLSQQPLAILPANTIQITTEEDADVSPKADSRVLPQEGTICRGVKKRTKEDTRKPKQFSPECRTIVSYNGVPVEVPFKSNIEGRSKGEILGPSLQLLKDTINSAGKSVIWQGDGPFSYVTSTDAIKLLHNEHVSPCIIDSWGELIVKSLTLKDKMTSTFVLTSYSWDCINKGNSGNRARYMIDKQLSVAVNCELIIVPVHIPAIPKKGTTGTHQWILLKYNTRNANWTVFNPLYIPDEQEDPYLVRVLDLIKYLENKLSTHLGNTDKNLPVARCKTKMTNELIQQRQTPNQLPCSNDDGVIVCHLIEKTLKRHSISSISKNPYGNYTRNTSANFRGRMVEAFCFPFKLNELKD